MKRTITGVIKERSHLYYLIFISLPHAFLYKYLLSHIAIVPPFSKNNLLMHRLLLIPSSKHCTKSGVAQEVRLILFLEEGTG